MEESPVLKEDRQDRALRALQIAAVSGFAEDFGNIQTSCLFLSNACRDGVPVSKLKIGDCVPSSLLGELDPGTSRLESQAGSRVLPYRRVLQVQWTIHDSSISTSEVYPFPGDKQRRKQRRHLLKVDLTEVKWPEGTTEIVLLGFDRSTEGIVWPTSLVRLAFCNFDSPVICWDAILDKETFKQPLDGVMFPAGLRELFLGASFNQPIDNVIFPEGLERLSMPRFNQSMQNVHWPVGLKTLEFLLPLSITIREINIGGHDRGRELCGFNQPLDATLPSTLETLWLSDDFNQPVDGVVWPTNLVKVGLGWGFRGQSLSRIVWPSTLQLLFVSHEISEGYGELPEDCTVDFLFEEDYSSVEDDGEEKEYIIDYDIEYYFLRRTIP